MHTRVTFLCGEGGGNRPIGSANSRRQNVFFVSNTTRPFGQSSCTDSAMFGTTDVCRSVRWEISEFLRRGFASPNKLPAVFWVGCLLLAYSWNGTILNMFRLNIFCRRKSRVVANLIPTARPDATRLDHHVASSDVNRALRYIPGTSKVVVLSCDFILCIGLVSSVNQRESIEWSKQIYTAPLRRLRVIAGL